jgi:hypothetical protein
MDSNFEMGACAGYEAVLEDYLNGALHGAELRRMSRHLNDCARCTAALEDAVAVNQWIREAEPAARPAPAFARNVMAQIHVRQETVRQERASFWEPLTSFAWKFAATSAFALVLMLTFVSRKPTDLSTDGVSVAGQTDEVSDMFVPGHSSVPDTRWELFMAPEEGENGSHH